MFRPAVRFAVAGSLCLLAVGLLPAQTTRERPMIYQDLIYLGNEPLHKELKLTAEQVKKITAFRDKWVQDFIREAVATRVANEKTKNLAKDGEKFLADTLDAKQRTRLRQVVLQQLARNPDRFMPAEAVADLKLTREQQDDLFRRGGRLTEVLNKEQKEAWSKLVGDPFPATLVRQAGSGFPGSWFDRAPVSETMRLLRLELARKDLGITEAQAKKLEDAQAKWQEAVKDYSTWTQKDRSQKLAGPREAHEKAVASILDAHQKKRLGQILLQQELTGPNDLQLFVHRRAVAQLDLTEAQKKQRDEILTRQRRALAEILLGDDDPTRISEKASTLITQTRGQLEGILTAGQKDTLKDLFGSPFTDPSRRRMPPTPPLLLSLEMPYLASPDLVTALKLTPEQGKKAADLYLRYIQESRGLSFFGDPATDTKRQELLKKYEKELSDVLGANQRKRFREIVLQVLNRQEDFLSRFSPVWTIREVIEGLKLTTEQRERMGRETLMEKILTAEQQKLWKGMTGEPFTGKLASRFGTGRGTGGPQWRRLASPAKLRYLAEKSVQEELKLTREQIADLEKVEQAWNQQTRDHANWKVEERAPRLNKAAAGVDEALTKLLQPAQSKRLEQIVIQNLRVVPGLLRSGAGSTVSPPGFSSGQGESNLTAILLYPRVAEALGMTEVQRNQVRAIATAQDRLSTLIPTQLLLIPSLDDRDELFSKTLATVRTRTNGKLRGLLTKKQQAHLEDLIGKPFKGPFRESRGSRGGSFAPNMIGD